MGRRPKTILYRADGRLQQKNSLEPGEALEFTTILGAEPTRVDISIRECKNGPASERVSRPESRLPLFESGRDQEVTDSARPFRLLFWPNYLDQYPKSEFHIR